MIPTSVPAWVNDYVGLPYLPGGRVRAGLDCWGLFALVWAERLGAHLPDYDGPLWHDARDAAAVAAAATAFAARFAPVTAPRLGDGALLRRGRHPLHIGLILAPNWMLHIEDGAPSCIERYDAGAWAARLVGLYRYTEGQVDA